MRNTDNSLLKSAARAWHPYPKLRGKSLADHIEQAVEECRTLTYRLEVIAQRARIEEELYRGRHKMENGKIHG